MADVIMKPGTFFLYLCLALLSPPAALIAAQALEPNMVEFIFDSAPFPSAHASTLAERARGWWLHGLAGHAKGQATSAIWSSRRVGENGRHTRRVATGVQADGTRFPTGSRCSSSCGQGNSRFL